MSHSVRSSALGVDGTEPNQFCSQINNRGIKMSDTQTPVVNEADAKKRQLQDVEAVRDLFARAHDYIAQATYPGHMGMKVAEVLNFLSFQYNDFKVRGENLKKQIDSTVDVKAAEAVVAETLATEAPKA